MTLCEALSDRMPDVVLGRSAWTAEEQAHLDGCPDCQAEWQLVRATARLGTSLPPLRSPEIMTATVLGRIVGERSAVRARRRMWVAAGLAAAAAIMIAVRISRSPSTTPLPVVPTPAPVAAGPVVPTPTTPRPAPTPVVATTEQTVSLPELDGLPDGELQAILGSLDEPTTLAPALDGSGLDNLDDHELEDALGAWEG
jgi:anti-sigma factor RsiW